MNEVEKSVEVYSKVFYYNGKKELQYDNLNCYQIVRINSIDELIPFSNSKISYSFRGQSNSKWPLKSSIERFFENRKYIGSKTKYENIIINKYRTEFTKLSEKVKFNPKTRNPLDVLSDIQHYGGPTKLLDFTSSFYIALFFATFNNYNTDSVVYCIRDLDFTATTFDIRDFLKGQKFASGVEESLPESKNKELLLFKHIPSEMNERNIAQKGFFYYPGSVEYTFEEALAYSYETPKLIFKMQQNPDIEEIIFRSSIIKVIIPVELKFEIQKYLRQLGVTASAIYPDYYGEIQSLYEL